LDVKRRLEKDAQIVDMCQNVRVTHSSVRTIQDNAKRIKESAKLGTKVSTLKELLIQKFN